MADNESSLRTDILSKELSALPQRVVVTDAYNVVIQSAVNLECRGRTSGAAKSLTEFYNLVRQVILDLERREETTKQGIICLTEEDLDFKKSDQITIVFSLVKRKPGAFGKGAPFESTTLAMTPILREELPDPDNPGYKRAVLGYCYDNEVRFTIFARTNKIANKYAEKFESLMMEYNWFFLREGVQKCWFLKRDSDFTVEESNAKMYGRPVHYFVRTEDLTTISQKTIEIIEIQRSTQRK